MRKMVWTIAGSDASGGAGIQRDIDTLQGLGIQTCSIITAITAQNNKNLTHIQYLSPETVREQITAIRKQFAPAAIKIGMLGQPAIIEEILSFLQNYSGFVICDPILTSSSGTNLFSSAFESYLPHLKKIFPFVDVLTPNITEAEKILARKIITYADMENAAHDFLTFGVKSILIKGGHFSENYFSQDYWTNGVDSFWLSNHRFPKKMMRGTGCMMSAALAGFIANNYEIKDALVLAKLSVHRAIRLSQQSMFDDAKTNDLQKCFNEDPGFNDLPFLNFSPMHVLSNPFKDCGQKRLGLYPILENVEWLKKLLPLGIHTCQLRIKNKNGIELENEIQAGILLARDYGTRLFINDYWELAIRYQAYGVHLGQTDLHTTDIKKIHAANLRLGISTHCYFEIARAHALRPSYIACGPIFHTTSKVMPFAPVGIHELSRWRKLVPYPIVAIGGIDGEKIQEVLQTDVDGIAMISGICKARDPIVATQDILRKINLTN